MCRSLCGIEFSSCVGIKARQLDELHVHAEAVEQYMWFGGSPFTLHSIRHTSPFTGAYHDAGEDSSPFTLHSIRHTSPFTGAYHDAGEDSSPFTLHSIRHTSPFTGAYHDAGEDSSPFTLHSIRHTSPFTGAYHDAGEDSSPFTLHSIRHTSPFTGAYEVPAKTAHPSVCWPEPTRNICLCFRLVGLEHPSLTIECEVESAPGSVGSFNPTAPGRLPHSPC